MGNRKIVQNYLQTITDNTERLVCFLLMQDCPEKSICKHANIDSKQFDLVKFKIAMNLKLAGIEY